MNPETWQKVSATLDLLIDLTPQEQAAFLGELREKDPLLAQEVESLIQQPTDVLLKTPPRELMDAIRSTQSGVNFAARSDAGFDPVSIQQAGRLRIEEEIARGGMGAIFRAHDPEIGRVLAVKVLLPHARAHPNAEARFLKEGQITGRLQHPGIPPIHEVGRLPDGLPYFAMKLIQGQTLAALIGAADFNSLDGRWVGIFEQVCRTLAYAHSEGVIHRDLKPSNVMVGAFGEVQVMDWGLAKSVREGAGKPSETEARKTTHQDLDGSFSQAGDVIGTPAFMAPEQARGETDRLGEACDVFGLGAILCALLTRKPPFSGKTVEMVRKSAAGDLRDAFAALDSCGADPALIEIARTCLAPRAEDRFADAREVADAVTRFREAAQEKLRQAELAREKAQVQVREEQRRRRVTLTLAASLLVLLASVSAVGVWYQQYLTTRQTRAENLNNQIAGLLDSAAKERQRLHDRLSHPRDVLPLLTNPRVWQDHLSTANTPLRQAQSLADSDAELVESTTKDRLEEMRALVDADAEDEDFGRALDAVRMEYFNLKDKGALLAGQDPDEDTRRVEGLLEKYAQLFEKKGWRFKQEDAETLGKRIRASPTRFAVAAALDSWAWMAMSRRPRNDAGIKRLLALAREIDPDSWRDRVRQWETWSNPVRLTKLLSEFKPLEQPPQIVTAAAGLQRDHGIDSTPVLRAALVHHPEDFWLNADLAFALLKLNSDNSVLAFRTALALRPGNSVVMNNLGVALMVTQNDHPSARVYFRKVLRQEPDHLFARCNLAKSLYLTSDLAGSIENYTIALKLAPDNAGVQNDLAVSLAVDGKLDAAIHHLTASTKSKQSFPRAHQNLAIILKMAGKYQAALDQMRTAHRLEPTKTRELFIAEYEWILRTSRFEKQTPVPLQELSKGLQGVLTTLHPRDLWKQAGCFRASHLVSLRADQPYQIDLTADFDALLRIEDERYLGLLYNDDIRNFPKPVLDSRIVFTPARAGLYRLVVTSFAPHTTGAYTLRAQETALAGPPLKQTGKLRRDDKVTQGKYYRFHPIHLVGNQPCTIVLQSQEFDTFLGLLDPEGKKYLAWNANMSHENTRLSRIDVTPKDTGTYQVYVRAAQPDKIGDYNVTVYRYKSLSKPQASE